MQDLRQSTASQVISLGQFLDSTDGDSEENGLTIANTDIKLRKHNTITLANKNSGGATNISNGVYHATLDATDSNTAGMLEIYVHVAGALAVKAVFNVLTQTAFDAKYTGTFNNLGGTAQTADHTAAIAAIPTTAMRGTDGANTTAPDNAGIAGIQTDLDNGTDGLGAIKSSVDGIPTTAMRGTDGANTATPPTTAQIWSDASRTLTTFTIGVNVIRINGETITGDGKTTPFNIL